MKNLGIKIQVGLWMGLLALAAAFVSAAQRNDAEDRDRGDVPGWVMITMMTSIVVIALLAVFKDAVEDAVQKAFDAIVG